MLLFIPQKPESRINSPLRLHVLAHDYPQNPISRPGGQDFHQIFLCTGGKGICSVEGKHYLIGPGDGFSLPAGCAHSYHAVEEPWSLTILGFSGSWLEPTLPPLLQKGACAFHRVIFSGEQALRENIPVKNTDSQIHDMVLDTINWYKEKPEDSDPETELSLRTYRILFRLQEEELSLIPPLPVKEDKWTSPEDIVRMITDHLEQHYSQEITAAQLEAKLHFSGDYLNLIFRRQMGYPIWHHLLLLRIGHALLLLQKEPDMSVRDIGIACGYPNTSFFIRQFKKVTGKTPGQSRKK